MDLDIDSILDQLEQQGKRSSVRRTSISFSSSSVNQSNIAEDEHVEDPLPMKKSIEELTLNDLDPYATGHSESETEETKLDDQTELFNLDLQQIYSNHSLLNEENPTTTVTLPTAVDHLEIELRQEVLQHQFETTPIVNGNHAEEEEEEEEEIPAADPTENSTSIVLHSVDSIVNATDLAEVEVN